MTAARAGSQSTRAVGRRPALGAGGDARGSALPSAHAHPDAAAAAAAGCTPSPCPAAVIALPASGVFAGQTMLLPAPVTALGLWVQGSVSHRANSCGRPPGPGTANSALPPGVTSPRFQSLLTFLPPTSVSNQVL